MTTTTVAPVRTRGEKFEGFVQVLILLTIGTVAAAASFTHVHNVAAAHGQPGWLAWADAVTLELMSIATGLEIRRRARTGRHAGFVAWVLVSAVALSLAAQVVEAEPSVIGWLAAALPALGFLACVKIVMSRTLTATATAVPDVVPAAAQQVPAVPDAVPAEQTVPVTGPVFTNVPALTTDPATPGQRSWPSPALPAELLDRARNAAASYLERTGTTITRDELRTVLRVSNSTTGDVMRVLGLSSRTVPAAVNGHPVTAEPALF